MEENLRDLLASSSQPTASNSCQPCEGATLDIIAHSSPHMTIALVDVMWINHPTESNLLTEW